MGNGIGRIQLKYLEAKVVVHGDNAIRAVDLVVDIFLDFKLQGVVIEEPGMVPAEGWGEDAVAQPENHGVIGYFPKNELIEQRCARLEQRLDELKERVGFDCRIYYREIDEADWAESWKAFFFPQRITDRVVIKPTWREIDARPDDIVIEIDPGMAFGTGIHPTTSTCIEVLQTVVKPGDRMLDVGTGSGILMVAGSGFGASFVCGVDVDEVAVGIAEKNLLLNGIDPERFTVNTGHLVHGVNGRFDVVCANILSEVILVLLEDIHQVLEAGGVLIASGIIEKNRDLVVEKMISKGFEIIEIKLKEGWATIAGRLKESRL
jgi:ribosomal protein L11 methyltransferase